MVNGLVYGGQVKFSRLAFGSILLYIYMQLIKYMTREFGSEDKNIENSLISKLNNSLL